MSTSTSPGAGRLFADRLALPIVGTEGHDLKCGCEFCGSSDAGRVDQNTAAYFCYSCNKALSAWDYLKLRLGHEAAKQMMVDVGLWSEVYGSNGQASTSPAFTEVVDPITGKVFTPSAFNSNGQAPSNQAPSNDEIIDRIARGKGTTAEGFRAYGAYVKNGSVFFPTFRLDGDKIEKISYFHIDAPDHKGQTAKDKPAGLFLPVLPATADSKTRVCRPRPGETCLITEGGKNAAAYSQLGYFAVGLNGHHVKKEFLAGFVAAFKDVDVVLVPDGDRESIAAFTDLGKKLRAFAKSAELASLPYDEIKPKGGGDDVRDILRTRGADVVRQAIDQAAEIEGGEDSIKAPATIKVAPGTRVKALDRGNFGTVNVDNGNSCNVHFVNPDTGDEADIDLPKSQLATEDGTPLEAPEIPPPVSLRQLVSSYTSLRPAVIDGLLRIGETMNLIAAPKARKSWLVSSLALSVPTGRRWLDTFVCNPGRVLIIDGELHPEVIAHRMRAVAEAMYVDRECFDFVDVLALRGRGLNLLNLGPFFDTIEPGQYSLVILDAWYRFIPPGVSESDNAQVMALYNKIDTYTERLKAAWVNVHHASKGDQSDKSTTDVGSGAGSQSRAADTHLIIRQHELEDVAVIEAVVRSWVPVDRLAIRWAYPTWELDHEVDPTKLRSRRGPKVGKDARLETDRRAIVEAIRSHGEPETESFFRGLSKISDYPRWNEAWVSLISDKTIRKTGETKKKDNGRSYPAWFFTPSETDQ